MNTQKIAARIRGYAPLIVHNAQLSDPLNGWAKAIAEISKKRKKTEDDLREMARREFLGSLYLENTEIGGDPNSQHPVIPSANLERLLIDAARKFKLGKQVQSGAWVEKFARIEYDGPRDPEELWADGGFSSRASCKVGQQRVMRTRPKWDSWELEFEVEFEPDVIAREDIIRFIEVGGKFVGLGDWRPRHGRFEILSIDGESYGDAEAA